MPKKVLNFSAPEAHHTPVMRTGREAFNFVALLWK